ncbi:hypothetical protein EDB85DRAFT_2287606 [Lactarius pseudohatsudake]|nr:hypothetical protein EDB85DRAFT_2287606 [Lactarius pseudohatsudake]
MSSPSVPFRRAHTLPDVEMYSHANPHPEAEEGQVDDGYSRDNPITQSSAKNYGDPSGKLWSMYLTEAKKEDDQKTKHWTKDAGGVLIFSGLFSTIVATFIRESYKQLSPDSGDQTVALLAQLVRSSNGAQAVVPEIFAFEPSASIVRVNVAWISSLVLSLSCALLATLIQKWARRYLDHTQHRSAPRRQARVRAYMSEGVEKFRLSQAVEAMPLLLHMSVFLFLVGLIDFLLPINDTVAFFTLGCVAIFSLTYTILTLLPTLRLNCPYHTPLSGITYNCFQLSALGFFSSTRTIEGIFHGFLLTTWRWTNRSFSSTPWHTKLREILDEKVSTYRKRFSHGLRCRVELSAMEASSRVDASALHWVLTTLDEDEEFEDFASRMPGVFNSRTVPDSTSAILSLISDQSTPQPILGARLRELLGTCLPATSLLTEERRIYRLRVCLMSLWYCARAYNLLENSEVPLAPYIRAVFASPQVIRWVQTEQDFATRLLGRCFGSLVVKKLAKDITRGGYITADIAYLSSILGATGEQVRLHRDAIDLMNVISLTSGELETLVASGFKELPLDVRDVFQQTLSILAKGIVSGHAYVEWDTDQVAQFHEIYSKFANARVPDVLKEPLRRVSERLTSSLDIERREITASSLVLQAPRQIEGVPDWDDRTAPT